jgi:hypothetical protein
MPHHLQERRRRMGGAKSSNVILDLEGGTAASLLDSALSETRCTKSAQKRGYEKVADLITP